MTGIEEAKAGGSIVFHAGTGFERRTGSNCRRTCHCCQALTEPTRQKTLAQSFQNAGKICFEKKYFRSDIGFDL